jgi:hypothetical protein
MGVELDNRQNQQEEPLSTLTPAQQELVRDAIGGFAQAQRRQVTGGHTETVELIGKLEVLQKLFSHANRVVVIEGK